MNVTFLNVILIDKSKNRIMILSITMQKLKKIDNKFICTVKIVVRNKKIEKEKRVCRAA